MKFDHRPGEAVDFNDMTIETITIRTKDYQKLVALSRRTLHIAYCWNDHNNIPSHQMAKDTARDEGIESFDDANKFIQSLPVIN